MRATDGRPYELQSIPTKTVAVRSTDNGADLVQKLCLYPCLPLEGKVDRLSSEVQHLKTERQQSCKSRADTRLRQSVNVHQNKRARCPAESSECRKQVFIYMVHLADRREYRVVGFYMCARCRLAAAYRRYGGFLYLKSLNNEYKLDIQQ